MILFIISLLSFCSYCSSSLLATSEIAPLPLPLQNYFLLLDEHPHLKIVGDHKKGEIELLLNSSEIDQAEKEEYTFLRKKGVSHIQAMTESRAGIVAVDPYLIWVRDPVIFPKGIRGLFKRIIWKCTLNGEKPIAVLPIINNKQIVLVKHWRHATGSWEFELPRGAPHTNETPALVAIRELKEETGIIVEKLFELGSVNPDSGILANQVVVFIAFGNFKEETQLLDVTETISGVYCLQLSEVETLLQKGYIDEENGGQRIFLRDPFLTYALYQAKIRHLL